MPVVPTPYRMGLIAPFIPKPQPPFPVRVNTVTGSSSGTGSALSPVSDLATAIRICSGYPDWEIEVVAPPTNPLRAETDYTSSFDLTIYGQNGDKWSSFASEQVVAPWTGAGPVYSKVLGFTTVGTCVVTTLAQTLGDRTDFQYKLLPNTATPTTPGPGEFGYVSGTLYVRLPGDENPAAHTIEAGRRNQCLTVGGTGLLTVRDLDGRYGILGITRNGLTGNPFGSGRMRIYNSFAGYTNNNGFGNVGQSVLTECFDCKAWRCENDGFNVHATLGGVRDIGGNVISATMILYRCDGSYNGDTLGDPSAQGTSNHEDSTIIVKGGRFSYNVSGGMVVIDQARCDLIGNDPDCGPILMDHNMRLGNTGGILPAQASCAWKDASKGLVTTGVEVSYGQGVGVKTDAAATVTGTENIYSHDNALADVLL